jgi:hypothetical protein
MFKFDLKIRVRGELIGAKWINSKSRQDNLVHIYTGTKGVSKVIEAIDLKRKLICLMEIFSLIRLQVFMAVTRKDDLFWDVTPCGSCACVGC